MTVEPYSQHLRLQHYYHTIIVLFNNHIIATPAKLSRAVIESMYIIMF